MVTAQVGKTIPSALSFELERAVGRDPVVARHREDRSPGDRVSGDHRDGRNRRSPDRKQRVRDAYERSHPSVGVRRLDDAEVDPTGEHPRSAPDGQRARAVVGRTRDSVAQSGARRVVEGIRLAVVDPYVGDPFRVELVGNGH
jgi:hypothetical protein